MTAPLDPIFASTFLYSACKVVGAERWPSYLAEQMRLGLEADWPALRTLCGELPSVCGGELACDASTYIDRARCVMAGRFLRSRHDVWLTVDDDIYTDADVLRRLILACRETKGGVAVPYMNRDGKSMTFRCVKGPTEWLTVGDVRIALRTVDRVGFGLVALHRELVEQLAGDLPKQAHSAPGVKWFRDSPESTVLSPHLFVNSVDDDGTFMGEDFHFSRLAERAGRPLRVLLEAPCYHQNLGAMLDVDGRICVADPAHAERLDSALRDRERALAGQPLETQGA